MDIRSRGLSYGYWTTRFQRDPAIVGTPLRVNDQVLTVIGVAQEGFAGIDIGETTHVFVPVMMKAQMTQVYLRDRVDDRRARWVHVFGRLKDGVTPEQAQASLQPYFHGLLDMEVKDAAFAKASAYTKAQFLKGDLTVLSGAQGWSRMRDGLRKPLWASSGWCWRSGRRRRCSRCWCRRSRGGRRAAALRLSADR